jgi:hypothetical protein
MFRSPLTGNQDRMETIDGPGGILRPDPSRPGHGLEFREDTARQYQIA